MAGSSRRDRPGTAEHDRTARARIRDAAIARFAEDGIGATSLKAIAEDVGVSPALVIHHFASKEGLRDACDQYVVGEIRRSKRAAMAAGRELDPLGAVREFEQGPPLLAYLARTLTESSPHVADLIDEMLEDAVGYMAEGVDTGLLKPTDHPRERAAVLLLWQLGALVLHKHAERLLGVDLTGGDSEQLMKWWVPAAEILAKGVLDEAFHDRWRDATPAEEQT
ncbi:MAG: TetR/AcrR family transcriptional regulator [Actinomycetota bacterium]